jgi:stearoyl-CoA desaturase (delta-9 desaturase)
MVAAFVALHLALGLVFVTGLSWEWVLLALASYLVRMFAVTAGYHRYFSHRAFKTNRLVQFLLAWVAQLSLQRGVLWWAARHRQHHKHADTAEDLHSPVRQGFWWAHAGWFLSRRYESTDSDAIKDFSRFPELVWLNDYWLVPAVSSVAFAWLLGGLPAVTWAIVVPTVLVWHASFAVNSLGHLFGKRRYLTPDTSRNSALLALLTLGDGWHNNHHRSQGSVGLGWLWFEFDPTFYALEFLSWVGVVRDLRPVRPEVKFSFREYTDEQRALLVQQSRFGKFEPAARVATPASQPAVAEKQGEHVGYSSVG